MSVSKRTPYVFESHFIWIVPYRYSTDGHTINKISVDQQLHGKATVRDRFRIRVRVRVRARVRVGVKFRFRIRVKVSR
jgi:hypothetical protein